MATATLPFSLLLTLSLLTFSATAVPEPELSAALTAMRSHGGYSLFANAVATSDLYTTLLSLSSVTLLAPTDAAVFSLDMSAASADDYVSSLRRHVIPRRLSLLALRSAPSGTNFPTLSPLQSLHLQTRLDSAVVSVDGAAVTSPGIFYSRSISVHGLESIILPRHQPSPPPAPADVIISDPPVANSPEISVGFDDVAMASANVAASMRSTVVREGGESMLSHVIMARGNTFTEEEQPMLTCPHL